MQLTSNEDQACFRLIVKMNNDLSVDKRFVESRVMKLIRLKIKLTEVAQAKAERVR